MSTREQSASRELEQIRSALDQAAIVAITDRAGKIIHINDKFCQISKYSREELLGQNHRMINSGYHSPDFFVEMWKTISSGKVWEGEIRNRAKDGSHYWVNTTIVPFADSTGHPYQYVSIRHEITERKNAEDQLRDYADRLEKSNQELQHFASVAAHDLQEPLRKIQTFGTRLNDRFYSTLQDDGKDYLTRMLSSASRMRKLIDDLLSYSRISTQEQPFQPTDLNQIVSEVVSDLEVRIEQSKAKIEKQPLPTILADPSQMRQLFQNLISNALKFNQVGKPPQIKIETLNSEHFVVLSIEDNGIGFEEKYLDRIFTIFQRLHGKHEYEGTGVGLAVCRKIVERHGGSITAQSRPGQGSRFLVTLPVKSASVH